MTFLFSSESLRVGASSGYGVVAADGSLQPSLLLETGKSVRATVLDTTEKGGDQALLITGELRIDGLLALTVTEWGSLREHKVTVAHQEEITVASRPPVTVSRL